MNSPVLLFAYNRPQHLQRTLDSLSKCRGIEQSVLYIFCDGPKEGAEEDTIRDIEEVQKLAKAYSKAKATIVSISESNKGLANSVYYGVSKVISEHEFVIVLEDDLELSTDFLELMNACGDVFKDRHDIYSVSGFSFLQKPNKYDDLFLFPRPGSWGWATWQRAWNGFRLNNISPAIFKNKSDLRKFDSGGKNSSWMLYNQMNGKHDSWAIQWCWHHFINHAYAVYPNCSKTNNIGFGEQSTHTKTRLLTESFTVCENSLQINPNVQPNPSIIRDYAKRYNLGLISRIRKFFLIGI